MKKNIYILLFFVCPLIVSAQQTIYYDAILRSNIGTDTMWDGNTMRIYGITPTLSAQPVLPAFTIYCNEGDSVVINARSISQGHHHTIHLHGLDVDTRNDGDPSTSFWLEHMQDTTYSFKATHAGTYIYHCHVGDVVHVQMGMYGLIVVRAAGGVNTAWTGGPAYSKDYKWLFSEIDEAWHDSIPEHDDSLDQIILPPYVPNYFLINGKAQQELADDSIKISGQVGEKIYMRLAGIGFYDTRIIFPSSLNAEVISSDGRPLPSPVFTDTVVVSPGERYGVMLTPSVEFTGTVAVEYINLNTDSIWQTEYPPVEIAGFIGISESQNPPKISVYPNPANSFIFIQSDQPVTSVSMDDMNGRRIIKKAVNGFSVTLPVDVSLPDGNYIINIRTVNENISRLISIKK